MRAAIEEKADVLLTGDKDFSESDMKNPGGYDTGSVFWHKYSGPGVKNSRSAVFILEELQYIRACEEKSVIRILL